MVLVRYEARWRAAKHELVAREPLLEEVKQHAEALSAAYNEPHNRSMMGHDAMSPSDVASYYAESGARGSRLFLLFLDGALAGDADFRHVTAHDAEFAFMIAGRHTQGKGLGTRYALMLHAFAFRTLRLSKVYVTILAANKASKRVFEKLGYSIDLTPEVRAHVDHEDDIAMSIARESFEAQQEAALREIEIQPRSNP